MITTTTLMLLIVVINIAMVVMAIVIDSKVTDLVGTMLPVNIVLALLYYWAVTDTVQNIGV